MKITVVGIAVLAICIVAAMLILEALRSVADLPWSDGVETALAAGVGALAWAIIMPRLRKAA